MRDAHRHAGALSATLEYLLPGADRPFHFMYPPPDGGPWQNAGYARVPVSIRDARKGGAPARLGREGFELRHAPSAVRDFFNRDEVLRVYHPEVARIALAATGASRAFVFDHLLRQRQAGA